MATGERVHRPRRIVSAQPNKRPRRSADSIFRLCDLHRAGDPLALASPCRLVPLATPLGGLSLPRERCIANKHRSRSRSRCALPLLVMLGRTEVPCFCTPLSIVFRANYHCCIPSPAPRQTLKRAVQSLHAPVKTRQSVVCCTPSHNQSPTCHAMPCHAMLLEPGGPPTASQFLETQQARGCCPRQARGRPYRVS